MTLLEQWRNDAYELEKNQSEADKFWNHYFTLEKSVYVKLLSDADTKIKGTVKELAEYYELEVPIMVGFLDGINDSLKTPNPIDTMDENTEVSLDFDPEKLYYNMVACKAEWLYSLPQWDKVLTEERRKELYKEQRRSTTFVRDEVKVGRNDPCPCGSGKKYKKCCGKNA